MNVAIPIAGLVIGAAVGWVIGKSSKSCAGGACIFTSNPYIAAAFLGFIGLMIGLSLTSR